MSMTRSTSPSERGLYTSHKELMMMKQGHRTPLKTNPAERPEPEDPELARASQSPEIRGTRYVTYAEAPPAELVNSPPRGYSSGVEFSHREFSADKKDHATPIRHRPTPGRGKERSVSPVRMAPRPDAQTPWASIDGSNPYQFRSPYPPTRVGDIQPRVIRTEVLRREPRDVSPPPIRNSPPAGYSPPPAAPASRYVGPGQLVDDRPVFEWQDEPSRNNVTTVTSDPPPAWHSSNYIPEGILQRPDRSEPDFHPTRQERHPKWADPSYDKMKIFTPNLSGHWIAQPGGDEVIKVTHDTSLNRIVGVVAKDASWSDIRSGQTIEGQVLVDGSVEMRLGRTPVLRLHPQVMSDGRLTLNPAPNTYGNQGYWDVVTSGVDQAVHAAKSPSPEPSSVLHSPRTGSVINIFA
eukprot:TRINITY_DN700_c1_g1_i1.p1 TRINITY_DN700_c1_g1~~TRINITY_DN700_c1_g1_i1.p1  ORF type:complete len:419 (+),score=54.78 TRINITY_DN700_c1_g1_i1:37-1257(+)